MRSDDSLASPCRQPKTVYDQSVLCFRAERVPSPTLSFPSLTSPLYMATLSPPLTRNRASSTNLRPALTLATLGPRPKACCNLDPIPGTPPVTPDICKVAPSLASPSRLSALIERCLDLLHVHSYLPPYSTPSSPRSPSEDSVLPMSSVTTTFGDDLEEKHFPLLKPSTSRSWFQSTPSVRTIFLSQSRERSTPHFIYHRFTPPYYL